MDINSVMILVLVLLGTTNTSLSWDKDGDQADDFNETFEQAEGRFIGMSNIQGPIHDTPPFACSCRKFLIREFQIFKLFRILFYIQKKTFNNKNLFNFRMW